MLKRMWVAYENANKKFLNFFGLEHKTNAEVWAEIKSSFRSEEENVEDELPKPPRKPYLSIDYRSGRGETQRFLVGDWEEFTNHFEGEHTNLTTGIERAKRRSFQKSKIENLSYVTSQLKQYQRAMKKFEREQREQEALKDAE